MKKLKEDKNQKNRKQDGEKAVLEKIEDMPEHDRIMAEKIHAIILSNAPTITPRLWYGMPAYAKDGKVICFFQNSQKFKTRYSTLGFSDKSNLDESNMWPVAYAIKELNDTEEKKIAELVKKAVG